MRADSLARKLRNNSCYDFWKDVKVINSCKTPLPSSIEGVCGSGNIAELWQQHYHELFNCVRSDAFVVEKVDSTENVTVRSEEAYNTIMNLEINKACGPDLISAEHLKYASLKLAPLLALCLTGFLNHGVLPDSMLSVLLVPVIKDKAGKINGIDNYRPIALASILSKVLEKILLDRLERYITTADNQFGFKRKHGTDMCIFALKDIIAKIWKPKCHHVSVFY